MSSSLTLSAIKLISKDLDNWAVTHNLSYRIPSCRGPNPYLLIGVNNAVIIFNFSDNLSIIISSISKAMIEFLRKLFSATLSKNEKVILEALS